MAHPTTTTEVTNMTSLKSLVNADLGTPGPDIMAIEIPFKETFHRNLPARVDAWTVYRYY